MSEAPADDLKGHVEITTATTIFIAINLMLANRLSSVSTNITNPNYTLSRLCWLGTQGFQHRGKWYSYLTVGKSKENLHVSHLKANRFLMVRLLKPQAHSERYLADFRSKMVGSTCRWLGWSDGPVGIDQLDSMIINPSAFGEFKSKSEENTKLTYLSETFRGAFSATKPAIWGLWWISSKKGELLGDVTKLTDPTWTT